MHSYVKDLDHIKYRRDSDHLSLEGGKLISKELIKLLNLK